jgi:hypothetical protein
VPTLGDTSIQPNDDSNSSGVIVVAGPYTTDSNGGAVSQAQVYIDLLSGSGTRSQAARLLLYNDNGSGTAPGTTLIGATDERIFDQTLTYANFFTFTSFASFGGPPTLAASTRYWTAIWFGTITNAANIHVRGDFSTGHGISSNATVTYNSTANPTTPSWAAPDTFNYGAGYWTYSSIPINPPFVPHRMLLGV